MQEAPCNAAPLDLAVVAGFLGSIWYSNWPRAQGDAYWLLDRELDLALYYKKDWCI